jgi:hypothetical protein
VLGETYGSGRFQQSNERLDWIWLYNPLSPHFATKVRSVREDRLHPEVLEYTELSLGRSERERRDHVYPVPGGDIPIMEGPDWIRTLWFRRYPHPEDPESWRIVVWEGGRENEYDKSAVYPEHLITFLLKWFTGEILVDGYLEYQDGVLPLRFEVDESL